MRRSRTRSSSSPAPRRASARPTPGRSRAEGAAVVVADLNDESGEAGRRGDRGRRRSRDLRRDRRLVAPSPRRRWSTARSSEFGGIDRLVNNAAIYGDMQFDLLITVDWDYYQKFMSVNMDGALVMTRAVYPQHADSAAAARSSTRARPRRASTPASTGWPRSASTGSPSSWPTSSAA